jgi:CRP/FNR family cyclic AMP-dependent transcriptional regulator
MKATKKPPFSVNKFLATVDGGRTMSNYGKNQAIFSQGDAADSVFYIRDGKIKVTVRSDQGKEAVVAIHGKGDFFGEGCLNGQPLRLASAVAMADSVIMTFTKASIHQSQHCARAARATKVCRDVHVPPIGSKRPR